jgi:TetR/AcrR family transcriptional regulator, transcriptional repressor of bet genes
MNHCDTKTSEPQKSRREQAKAERRRALIEATITSIAKYGLSGTTIARVTEIAGTSIGLANFHFENKERLFEAVLQHLADAERALWLDCIADATQTPAERLVALVDARFDTRICNPRTLSVWFAFWGDAGARTIYRRVVGEIDDARLKATITLIKSLKHHADHPVRNATQTALGLEAFYDGLWLNLLLYSGDFKRNACRRRAVEHLCALFPNDFDGLQTVAKATPSPGKLHVQRN